MLVKHTQRVSRIFNTFEIFMKTSMSRGMFRTMTNICYGASPSWKFKGVLNTYLMRSS